MTYEVSINNSDYTTTTEILTVNQYHVEKYGIMASINIQLYELGYHSPKYKARKI